MAKIDLEKFICSMIEAFPAFKEEGRIPCMYKEALENQGLEFKDGQIVEISKPHEPKFKVGDFVVIQESTYQIIKIGACNVTLSLNGRECMFDNRVLRDAHLWTVQDAKRGDVLVVDSMMNPPFMCIFKSFDGENIKSYCYTEGISGILCVDNITHDNDSDELKPATKEQCDLLFQKMTEAGYKWNAEKKELKKIQKPDLDNTNGTNSGSVPVRIILNWLPISEYTGGRVLATNGLDIMIGEVNSEGDCESEDCTILCGITYFAKPDNIFPKCGF